MEEQTRPRSRLAVLIVSENENGEIKKKSVNSWLIEITVAIIFILGVIAVCKIIYDTILIEDMQAQMTSQLIEINNLNDENEALQAVNSTLYNKVSVLSETVSNKMQTAEELEAETIEKALPKGFPLNRTATMQIEYGDNPIVIFTAQEDTNVITTGTGIVERIEPDKDYGTKIVINHENGYKSIYLCNNKAMVESGDKLGKGYILFQLGEENTELGYQILKDDICIDPLNMMQING